MLRPSADFQEQNIKFKKKKYFIKVRTEFSRGQTTGARRALNRRAVRFRIWRWRPLIGHWTVPFIFFFFIFTQTDTLRETSPLHWLRCVRNNRHIIRRVRREVKVCTLCARFYSTPMQYAPSNYRYCITSMMRRKVSFNLKRNFFFPSNESGRSFDTVHHQQLFASLQLNKPSTYLQFHSNL